MELINNLFLLGGLGVVMKEEGILYLEVMTLELGNVNSVLFKENTN